MEATAAFSPGEQSSYNQHTKNIWCNYPIFVLLPLTVCRLWFASIWKWWWSFKCNSFTMTVSSHHPEDVMRQRINKWSSLYKFCFLKLFFCCFRAWFTDPWEPQISRLILQICRLLQRNIKTHPAAVVLWSHIVICMVCPHLLQQRHPSTYNKRYLLHNEIKWTPLWVPSESAFLSLTCMSCAIRF